MTHISKPVNNAQKLKKKTSEKCLAAERLRTLSELMTERFGRNACHRKPKNSYNEREKKAERFNVSNSINSRLAGECRKKEI